MKQDDFLAAVRLAFLVGVPFPIRDKTPKAAIPAAFQIGQEELAQARVIRNGKISR
jgi:hypothetical protein